MGSVVGRALQARGSCWPSRTEFAARLLLRERRCAHAGRRCSPLMQMSQDERRARAAMVEERVPYISVLTDPDDGRRFRQPRDARRPSTSREPQCADRLRRSARDRADGARRSCPKGFQRSEFLLEHGAPRHDPRSPPDARRHRRAARQADGIARRSRERPECRGRRRCDRTR